MAPDACTTMTMDAPVCAVSSDSTFSIFDESVLPPS
jgi:hypothetical protein